MIGKFLKGIEEKYKAGGFLALWNSIPEGFSQTAGKFIAIVFSSYVTASVCSAGVLMVLVDFSLKPQRLGANANSVDAKLPDFKSPNYFAIRKGVVNRNLFNSKGEVPDESSSSGDEVEMPQGEFKLEGPCTDTKLPLKLTGTIYMGKGGVSLASIVDSTASATDTYKQGDVIIDHPNAVVALIERKRVILNNGGLKECLEVDIDENSKKMAQNYNSNDNASMGGDRLDTGNKSAPVSGVSAGETVVLTSSYVEEQLGEGFGKVIQAARLVPKNDSGGNPEGFKIFAIKPDSILSKVGFQNGDVITKVNDTSMKRPDQGFALYQSLQDENDIVIQVLRGGTTPTDLKVQIK